MPGMARSNELNVYGTLLDVRLRGDSKVYRSHAGPTTDLVAALQSSGVDVGEGGDNAVHLKYHDGGLSAGVKWLVQVALFVILGALGYAVLRLALGPGRLPKEDRSE